MQAYQVPATRTVGISRRAFLVGVTTAAAITALPLATAERAAALVGPPALLKRSSFTPLLKAPFRMLDRAGRSANVVLSQVGDLRPALAAARETRFSLVFDGSGVPAWPQGTYRFSHPRIGVVALFVVPVDRGVSGRHYRAIICQ
jgi:hypothetical protein